MAQAGAQTRARVTDLPGVWRGVDGYTDLLDWLERSFTLSRPTAEAPGNLLVLPYDWRLSCRHNAGLPAARTAREPERRQAPFLGSVHLDLSCVLSDAEPPAHPWPGATPADRDRDLSESAAVMAARPGHAVALGGLVREVLAASRVVPPAL